MNFVTTAKLIPIGLALTLTIWAAPQDNKTSSGETIRSEKAKHSFAATDLLGATSLARSAILAQDKEDAIEHIDHALDRARDLEKVRFVPIYSELSQYSLIGPMMEAKKGSGQAGQQNSADRTAPQANATSQQANAGQNRTPAQNQSNTQKQGQPAIQSVIGEFTSVGLDVSTATEHLNAAKEALRDGDFGKADAALKAVENGVTVTTVTTDLPLVRARENLMLARASANAKNPQQTRAALKEAAEALRTFQSTDKSKDLTQVRTEIEKMSQGTDPLPSDAVSKIDNWWEKVTDSATNQDKKG